jgi:membrane-bound serine protease (ClpP class)
MDKAVAAGAQLIVLKLNTPGGLDMATRDIIQAFLLSPVPVATYVYPSGSRAASAGTFMLFGSHIAAMTPASNLGSATPIQMGGQESVTVEDATNGSEEATTEPGSAEAGDGLSAMERKVINDSVAYIRGLAERHGRNADWAEQAVRDAVNVTAKEALELGVIDIVAETIEDLLNQAEGRTVAMEAGTQEISVAGLPVIAYDPDWRNELLSIITSPQIAYILLLVGIYGLILEGYNPGALVPGVIGAISLLLGLYALQMLPINYVGLALMILGALLIMAEAFVPSFGILGIGGVVALVLGSIMLIDTDAPGMEMPYEIIGAVAAVSGLVVLYIVLAVGKVLRMKTVPADQAMVSQVGVVRAIVPQGYEVLVMGELWKAQAEQSLAVGDAIQVVGQNGLLIHVEPVPQASTEQQLKET